MASAYAEAIDATRDAIVDRARLYKRLVIAVSLAGVAAFGALLAGQAGGLLAFAALMPATVLGFSLLDALAVQRWRARLLGPWIDGRLQLDIFLRTMQQVPGLPQHTVAGMLDTVPGWPADTVPPPLRTALGRALSVAGRLGIEHLLLRTVMAAVGGLAVMLALWFEQLAWLAPAALALPGWWAWQFDARRRARRCSTEAARQLALAGIAPDLRAAWLSPLPWQGTPAPVQAAWRSGLAIAGPAAAQACSSA
jgi:hypothetical protein